MGLPRQQRAVSRVDDWKTVNSRTTSAPDGHNRNLYAGTIGRLSVQGSHFYHATVGHLLRNRAAVNYKFSATA